MVIKDYKANSEGDIQIIVEEKDEDSVLVSKTLYRGSLADCPSELDELVIDSVGRSLAAEQKGETLYYLTHLSYPESIFQMSFDELVKWLKRIDEQTQKERIKLNSLLETLPDTEDSESRKKIVRVFSEMNKREQRDLKAKREIVMRLSNMHTDRGNEK